MKSVVAIPDVATNGWLLAFMQSKFGKSHLTHMASLWVRRCHWNLYQEKCPPVFGVEYDEVQELFKICMYPSL